MKSRYFGKQNTHIPGHQWEAEGNNVLSSLSLILRASFATLAAASALYASLFYLPAFLNQEGVVRVAKGEKVIPSLNREGDAVSWRAPYLDLLRLRRGYFNAGSILEIEYIMSDRGSLNVAVQRCSGPVIVEIISCKVVDEIQHQQLDSTRGKLTLGIPQNGFYRMTETAKSNEGNPVTYSVVWRRK